MFAQYRQRHDRGFEFGLPKTPLKYFNEQTAIDSTALLRRGQAPATYADVLVGYGIASGVVESCQ